MLLCHFQVVFVSIYYQETFLQGLGIVHVRFDLNDTTNLTNRKLLIT